MKDEIVVALVGNPNSGKTSLFNALTGARQHVGNWPGVTVEKKEGKLTFEGKEVRVVDLPGTYSLGAYSEDEVVARDFILKENPDVVINVVDSTNIERNLYLTTQLLEMDAKVILALNMMDEAEKKDIKINQDKLAKSLGAVVVPTIATKKNGIKELIKESIKLAEKKEKTKIDIKYGNALQQEIDNIKATIEETACTIDYPAKWTAIKLLENDEYIMNHLEEKNVKSKISNVLKNSIKTITNSVGVEPDAVVVDKRYEFIASVTSKAISKKENNNKSISDKIDSIVTNNILGIPIFVAIMFLMYQITMAFGNDYLGGIIDEGFGALGEWAEGALSSAPDILKSFIVDGLIGGLGSVFVFIPLILVMYFIISILEDSGYMARAAYVMDKLMQSLGLHGKTAVSMIIGSGCNIAGIMSTRTLESKKDRMIAILVNPFISCGARMPVYAVFAGAFFGGKKIGMFSASGVVVFSLYALGILVAIISAKVFSKTLFKGESSYFVMELPPYRIPTVKGIATHMWEKASAFVKKAGTIIFAVVVLVWVLSNVPFGVEAGGADSVLGIIGGFIAPLFKPLGFSGWESGVALITGILAKEAVVGTLATVYAVSEEGLTVAVQANFTALSAYSFMVFTLLYAPCCAALGAIRRETNSHKWAIFSAVYTTSIAYIVSLLIYQVGTLLGF